MPESAQKLIHELTAAGLLSAAEITNYDREIAVGVHALIERLVADGCITRYQADKFLAGQSSEIYFGDYVVLEELGRGGMGTVLLARHRRMEREVAIKILPVTTLDSEMAVARFYQEVKVAAQLTHPNIVHAYDAGEHHGFHYLVMEYVRGHDLARMQNQLGAFPMSLALDYTLQTCRGLQYAHRKGIVHRDIKPSNLLLDQDGTIKILDMGLARLGSGLGNDVSVHLTTTGQVMGTVEYMSPEQAEDTRLADARSDIYSLGCTLVRLVTGQSPFARDTVVKTILAHREADIPNLSVYNPELAVLNPLVSKMLAKRPTDRYQNVADLTLAIEQLIERTADSSAAAIIDVDVEIVRSPHLDSPTLARGSSQRAEIVFTSPTAPDLPPVSRSSAPQSADDFRLAHVPAAAVDASHSRIGRSNPYHALEVEAKSGDRLRVKRHRGHILLFSGILSVLFAWPCLFGAALGIMTWVYAAHDLGEMRLGQRDSAGGTLTKAARILGMVACGIGALLILKNYF